MHLFERTTQKARAKGIKGTIFAIDDPALLTLIEPDLWAQVQEEIELLDEVSLCSVLLCTLLLLQRWFLISHDRESYRVWGVLFVRNSS